MNEYEKGYRDGILAARKEFEGCITECKANMTLRDPLNDWNNGIRKCCQFIESYIAGKGIFQ